MNHSHPGYKKRFNQAEMIGEVKAMNIPFVSTKNKLYEDRHMLIGDAASLADTFFGQGIANALRSGQFAAKQALTCFETCDFSSKLISGYQDQLYGFLEKEIKYSKNLQTFFSYNCLVNNLFFILLGKQEVLKIGYC